MFGEVIDGFQHSGLVILKGGDKAVYLGLDICLPQQTILLSHDTFISTRLAPIEMSDIFDAKTGKMREISRRKTIGRQIIGSLLWAVHARIDLHSKISRLASSISRMVSVDSEFGNG